MLDATPTYGQRVTPARPPQATQAAPLLDSAENDGLGPVTRELAAKLDAQTGLLVAVISSLREA
jgi:hypothetical protein